MRMKVVWRFFENCERARRRLLRMFQELRVLIQVLLGFFFLTKRVIWGYIGLYGDNGK